MRTRDNFKPVAAALAIVGAALLACPIFPSKAHAQLAVTDPPVEAATADMDTVQEPGILAQDTATATSVTTGGGGGQYQPNTQYIASLDQQLFSGINAQNFASWFPGWVALPPDSTDTIAIPLTNALLTTYGQALAVAQSQAGELAGENLSNIETISTNATAVLQAIQANTEAQLQTAQEVQYLRQLVATLITVEATKAGAELNERAREEATDAMSFNLGIVP